MPQFFIEAPAGIAPDAKRRLMREVTDAIDEAYHMRPEIQVWLREYSGDAVSYDGELYGDEPMRIVGFLEAPELASTDASRKLTSAVNEAIGTAYQGIANTDETLILMNRYPLHAAGFQGRLQSDDPEAVEAIAQLNA
ncbi:tautomerase family protein [Glycomyces terrestris]|uniref:N-acetylmuramic acid 6-phosphate etherase n=1 Tax=Glycomyces terrestris TaxID=2493553 RepID=A0A426V2Y8_9ACTN|nr:N-acetylmuramic acid 6-phosphate etherase [Glycomyces terrestris]RRS01211.1 N-acetylmuramic acid 6-phosphate etherase [Glycomyces terrestris]